MTSNDDEGPPFTVYRWTCPICRASNSGIAVADEDVWTKAVESLKTHLRNQSGEGHGPHGSRPPELAGGALRDCIDVSSSDR